MSEQGRQIDLGRLDPAFDPIDNKFHRGSDTDGKHYWLTPPALMAELTAEFEFDFDPCPHPLPDGFNGLTAEWGQSNYVNPPFGSIMVNGHKRGPTAWARKAIIEHRKGKRVVLVYPVDKWVLMLTSAGATVRNLGDVHWHAIEDGSRGPGIGRHVAAFILEPGAGVTEDAEDAANRRARRFVWELAHLYDPALDCGCQPGLRDEAKAVLAGESEGLADGWRWRLEDPFEQVPVEERR